MQNSVTRATVVEPTRNPASDRGPMGAKEPTSDDSETHLIPAGRGISGHCEAGAPASLELVPPMARPSDRCRSGLNVRSRWSPPPVSASR